MKTNAARVIDPILSGIVQGYSNASFIYTELAPHVMTPTRGGTVLKFGKEHFQVGGLNRAPGADAKRFNFGYSGEKYSTIEHTLEATVERAASQEADAVPGINMATEAVNAVMDIIQNDTEYNVANVLRDASNYATSHKVALTGSDKWSDPSSKIIAQVRAAKEVIRATTGKEPNVLAVSAKVWVSMQDHPDFVGRVSNNVTRLVTPELVAAVLGLAKVVIGGALHIDAKGNFVDTWGTDAILAFVTPNAAMRTPNFAYTYLLEGNPLVEAPYYENSARSWIYGVTKEYAPVIAGNDAGFLFKNAV